MAARQPGGVLEFSYAPDGFGIQLLGCSYTGNTPTLAGLGATELGGGAELLESAEPAAWYQNERPDTETLTPTRDTLRPLIATDLQVHDSTSPQLRRLVGEGDTFSE